MSVFLADKISKETFLRLIDEDILYLDFIEASYNTSDPDLTDHEKYIEVARARMAKKVCKETTQEDPTHFEIKYSFVPAIRSIYESHLEKDYATIRKSWRALANILSDKEWLMFWISNFNLDMVSAYCEVYDEEAKTDAAKASSTIKA